MRKQGVEKLVRSFKTKGYQEEHLWKVEEIKNPTEGGPKYRVIDCNHQLAAAKICKIPKVKAVVFPPMEEKDYDFIAGISNKSHDEFSVHVTDWEKYNVLLKYFRNKAYKQKGKHNIKKIVEDVVFLF